MRRLLCAFAIIAAGRAPARADGAAEEMTAGNTPHASGASGASGTPGTPGTPSSSWIASKLSGLWEPGDDWQLRIDLTGTRYFDTRTSDVLLANLAVEYDPDAHWTVRLAAGGSPSSMASARTAVQGQGAAGAVISGDATLETTSSSVSGSAGLGYETAGDGDLETSAVLSTSVTQLDSLQQITAIQGRKGQTLTLAQLQAACAAHPCTNGLGSALAGQPASLLQLVVGASLSEQLYRNTDVGLDGSYYLYDKDPTQVGTLSITRAGQTAGAGGGLGIAPVRYSVMPSLIHRFGPVMAMSSVAYSKYVDQQGYDVSATLRIQYKLAFDGDRRLKLWAKLVGSRDVDQMNATTKAGAASLGAQYMW
jgi:hypothetical protein